MKLEIYLALTGSGISEADAKAAAEAIEQGVISLVAAQRESVQTGSAIARIDAEVVRLDTSQLGLAKDLQLIHSDLVQRFIASRRWINGSICVGFGILLAVMIALKPFA